MQRKKAIMVKIEGLAKEVIFRLVWDSFIVLGFSFVVVFPFLPLWFALVIMMYREKREKERKTHDSVRGW